MSNMQLTTAHFTAANRFYQSFAEDRRVNMYLFACVITVLCTFTFAAETNSVCKTPNGEDGTCISIESCTVIKRAIAFLNPEAVQFAKDSYCGYEEYPLVCCGSTGRPTTPAPEGGTPEPETLPNPQSYPDHVSYQFLPDSSLCGIQTTEDRKATSTVAEIDEFPWLAILKYVRFNDGNETSQCTGTLISNRYVVTAANCLDLPGLKLQKIRLGDWHFSSFEDCDPSARPTICTVPQDYDIAEQTQHPHYNKATGDNNIALIRLKQQVKYSEFIRAICLAPRDHPSPDGGAQVEASAWGFSENGQKYNSKLKMQRYITSAETCSLQYPHNKNINVNAGCFTAEGDSPKCAVDDGSPLMRTYEKSDSSDEEQFYLEGIAYNGHTCLKTAQPCLYTRASRYTEWIANNLKP